MPESRCWSWRQAITQSGLPPTTRHVLHAISFHMNEHGEGCYPSEQTLAKETGYSRETVNRHISKARSAGWIEVRQFGFRGQKWRRNEYVARWPERDLLSTVIEPEGSDGGSQPCSEKVVIESQEGCDPPSHKVVIEDHTNPPRNPPINPPSEREGAREDEEEGTLKRSRDQSRRLFRRGLEAYPEKSGSASEAEREWFLLTDEQQDQAIGRMTEQLAVWKSGGRSYLPAFSTYLRKRFWEGLPAKPLPRERTHVGAAAYGKLWGARRFSRLLHPPTEKLPKPPDFIRLKIEGGGPDGEKWKRHFLAQHGWPSVKRMHADAQIGRGDAVPKAFENVVEEFRQVQSDSVLMAAWRNEHERRGWPWFEGSLPQFVWMPAGDNPRESLVTFEATLRAAGLIENEERASEYAAE